MSAVLQDRLETGVEITKALPGQETILNAQALELLAGLHRRFEAERQALLAARAVRRRHSTLARCRTSAPTPPRSAPATGRWPRHRPRCVTGASKSPGRSIRKW